MNIDKSIIEAVAKKLTCEAELLRRKLFALKRDPDQVDSYYQPAWQKITEFELGRCQTLIKLDNGQITIPNLIDLFIKERIQGLVAPNSTSFEWNFIYKE